MGTALLVAFLYTLLCWGVGMKAMGITKYVDDNEKIINRLTQQFGFLVGTAIIIFVILSIVTVVAAFL